MSDVLQKLLDDALMSVRILMRSIPVFMRSSMVVLVPMFGLMAAVVASVIIALASGPPSGRLVPLLFVPMAILLLPQLLLLFDLLHLLLVFFSQIGLENFPKFKHKYFICIIKNKLHYFLTLFLAQIHQHWFELTRLISTNHGCEFLKLLIYIWIYHLIIP